MQNRSSSFALELRGSADDPAGARWFSRLGAKHNLVTTLKSAQVSADGFASGGGIALLQGCQDFLVLFTRQVHAVGQKQALSDQFLQGAADMPEQFGEDLVLAAGGYRKMELQV